jgi:hypothetical protein
LISPGESTQRLWSWRWISVFELAECHWWLSTGGWAGELTSARLAGMGVLRTLISERVPNCAFRPTELETLVRRWLRRYSYPEPIFQFWVQLPDYGPSRLDFAYPELQIGVEADSYAWHSGREAFERDRVRNSEYASLGWIIIQTTHREIESCPDRPARRLRAAFDQRM